MDPRIIHLYDEYTHAPLDRRVFLQRLTTIAGGTAAATALLPLLENNYAQAAIVDPADARLNVSTVTYKGHTGDIKAYLATPKAGPAKRPAVVVIHENRGLNPHIEDVTRRVALEGFTALGLDLLSPMGGTPKDEDQAREMIGKTDRNDAVRNAAAAIAYLKSRADASGSVGATGFCWGGGMTNLLATIAPDLAAGAPYYGLVAATADVPKIKAKMQLHYAGNDPRINEGLPGYEAAMKAAGVQYQLFVYQGAEHAFNNDTNTARYNKTAADLAWSRTIAFFKQTLGATPA